MSVSCQLEKKSVSCVIVKALVVDTCEHIPKMPNNSTKMVFGFKQQNVELPRMKKIRGNYVNVAGFYLRGGSSFFILMAVIKRPFPASL